MKFAPCLALFCASVSIACSPVTPIDEEIEQDNSETHGLLDPPAPPEGVQYQMVKEVMPGEELYGCKMFVAPPEGLYVNREAVRFSAGGHHVLLYRTPYEAIPRRTELGDPIDAEAIHDCSMGATALWKVTGVLGGSESYEGRGLLEDLPEGVAIAIDPGAVIVMSTHYLNATPSPIEVDSRINLYTIPKEHVKAEAGVLYFDNPIIRVPAGGASTARVRCPISKDISIVSLQSHMHARGTAFSAMIVGVEGGPKEIYETTSWKEPPVKDFSPALSVRAGQLIDYRCSYRGAGPLDVVRGETSDDEMCQLIGPYYPRDRHLEACEDENGESAARWVGSGTATCAQVYACLKEASPIAKDGGAEAFACVLSSRASEAKEVSALMRCRMKHDGGACKAACTSLTSSGACEGCLAQVCAEEVHACSAAIEEALPTIPSPAMEERDDFEPH